MHADDACSARSDELLDAGGIKIVGFWINVAKHRSNSLPAQRVRRGNKCERRNDDLAFELQRAGCDLERDRGIANRDAMTNSEDLLQFAFKGLNIFPCVR